MLPNILIACKDNMLITQNRTGHYEKYLNQYNLWHIENTSVGAIAHTVEFTPLPDSGHCIAPSYAKIDQRSMIKTNQLTIHNPITEEALITVTKETPTLMQPLLSPNGNLVAIAALRNNSNIIDVTLYDLTYSRIRAIHTESFTVDRTNQQKLQLCNEHLVVHTRSSGTNSSRIITITNDTTLLSNKDYEKLKWHDEVGGKHTAPALPPSSSSSTRSSSSSSSTSSSSSSSSSNTATHSRSLPPSTSSTLSSSSSSSSSSVRTEPHESKGIVRDLMDKKEEKRG